MQSSGVGNTINLMGMPKTLRFPFLTLITMRGDWGEFNSWQYPMGQGTPKVLEAMGVLQQHIRVFYNSPANRVMLIPAGTGCVVIKKEIVH